MATIHTLFLSPAIFRVVACGLVLSCCSCKKSQEENNTVSSEVDSAEKKKQEEQKRKQEELKQQEQDLRVELAEREISRDASVAKVEAAQEQLRAQETAIAALNTSVALKMQEINKLKTAEPSPAEIEVPSEEEEKKQSLPDKFLSEMTPKVVVIEGDQGSGTGFLCEVDGQVWIYTAAHVLSGNNKIKVRDNEGRIYKDFDYLESAEGVDLVRLKLKNHDVKGLSLVSPKEAPKEGDVIVAIGNSLGTGSLSGEPGKIMKVEEDMWEVDAEIIPGNSGGPILSLEKGKVVGIVTHLIIHRREGEDSLHGKSETKRFAARLDKEWEWRRMPVANFVKEWKYIDKMNHDSAIAWATIYLMQVKSNLGQGSRYSQQGSYGQQDSRYDQRTAEQRRAEQKAYFALNKIAEEIIAREPKHFYVQRMKSFVKKAKGVRRSTRNALIAEGNTIRKKIQDEIRLDAYDPEAKDFSWYHRKSYESARNWRIKLTRKN